MLRSIIMLAAGAALFSGCAGASDGTGPRGWNHSTPGRWSSPRSKRDEFTVARAPYDGTLKDLASLTTTNIVLQTHGKLVKALPLPDCPALAGLQVFDLPGGRVANVGFAVRNGRRVQAEYVRLSKEPDDPDAINALSANVCALP